MKTKGKLSQFKYGALMMNLFKNAAIQYLDDGCISLTLNKTDVKGEMVSLTIDTKSKSLINIDVTDKKIRKERFYKYLKDNKIPMF